MHFDLLKEFALRFGSGYSHGDGNQIKRSGDETNYNNDALDIKLWLQMQPLDWLGIESSTIYQYQYSGGTFNAWYSSVNSTLALSITVPHFTLKASAKLYYHDIDAKDDDKDQTYLTVDVIPEMVIRPDDRFKIKLSSEHQLRNIDGYSADEKAKHKVNASISYNLPVWDDRIWIWAYGGVYMYDWRMKDSSEEEDSFVWWTGGGLTLTLP